jgi:hypothetical protein
VEEDLYTEHVTRIQRIVTFQQDNKKVQLIIVGADNLKDYVANQFDLSVCMTWWCPESGGFETVYPALTRQKKMFIRRQGRISQGNLVRETERIQKYVERGFVVVEEPPPFCYSPDTREEEDIAVWEGLQAFDVWLYEEVNARQHLRHSDWNILVGCGPSWWAFDRRTLIAYMEERRTVDDEKGIFYDTPYRQTVIHEGWDILAYSDYSVYRLVDGQEKVICGGQKTVYAVEAYSAEGWRLGVVAEQIGQEMNVIQIYVPPEEVGEVREEAEVEEAEEEEEEEAEEEKEDSDENDVLLLLCDELGIHLPPSIASSSSVSMTLSEAALYQEMMGWLDQDQE